MNGIDEINFQIIGFLKQDREREREREISFRNQQVRKKTNLSLYELFGKKEKMETLHQEINKSEFEPPIISRSG